MSTMKDVLGSINNPVAIQTLEIINNKIRITDDSDEFIRFVKALFRLLDSYSFSSFDELETLEQIFGIIPDLWGDGEGEAVEKIKRLWDGSTK